jgi:hypothetical protein
MNEAAEIRDVLVRVRRLLDKPDAWTQGAEARNAAGIRVEPHSPQAVHWCLEGAVCRVLPTTACTRLLSGTATEMDAVLRWLERRTGTMIANYNDRRGRTYAEILAALDTWIAELADSGGTPCVSGAGTSEP